MCKTPSERKLRQLEICHGLPIFKLRGMDSSKLNYETVKVRGNIKNDAVLLNLLCLFKQHKFLITLYFLWLF